jgi:hypothetical protein
MALSATISLAQTPISFNQQSSANVTISNSGGSAVSVVTLSPQILASSAPSYETNTSSRSSSLPKGFGQQFSVPASGSVVVPFNFVVFSPQVAMNSQESQSVGTTYSISCNIETSDGSAFAPASPATLTITPNSVN